MEQVNDAKRLLRMSNDDLIKRQNQLLKYKKVIKRQGVSEEGLNEVISGIDELLKERAQESLNKKLRANDIILFKRINLSGIKRAWVAFFKSIKNVKTSILRVSR